MIYFIGVSALIALIACFVRGVDGRMSLAAWCGVGALAGLITGLLVAGGVFESAARRLAVQLASGPPDNVTRGTSSVGPPS